MITYDRRTNVGFDFDFNLELQRGYERFSPKELRDFFRNAISKAARKAGYDFAEDSSRVLTIKKKDCKHSRILYSADFAIVCCDDEDGQWVIRFDKRAGRYIWNEQTEKNEELASRQRWIKEKKLWNDLCDLYLDKKNDCRNEGMHSRQLFSMAVNEICLRNGYFSEEEPVEVPCQQVKFGPMMIRLW